MRCNPAFAYTEDEKSEFYKNTVFLKGDVYKLCNVENRILYSPRIALLEAKVKKTKKPLNCTIRPLLKEH